MQTISIPYRLGEEDAPRVTAWRRAAGRLTRAAYAAAATWDAATGSATFADPVDVERGLKARLARADAFGAVDAWILHCAVLDGFACRRRVPDGSMVFGGRANLERRRKGLIDNAAWKALRLRPLCSVGDKNKQGNRHFRLSADARTCTIAIYGKVVVLSLPRLRGKWGALLPMLAAVAAAKEVSLTFRLGDRLEVCFDEGDLRRLPHGVGLEAAKDADAAANGRRRRGRPRGPGYVAPVPAWTPERPRPVHPEWREPAPVIPGRVLGIDLNPNWVGMTVVENRTDPFDLAACHVVDHRLVRLDVPPDAPDEVIREALAHVAGRAVALARAMGAGTIAVEAGLGKLRSGGRNRGLNRAINGWARERLLGGLGRRARLAGIAVVEVWCGYSTTIGNIGFPLPDACAAAGEIARRGIVVAAGRKHEGLLPAYRDEVVPGLWKDRESPIAGGILRRSGTWGEAHRGLKAAKLGVRRPHPAPPGPEGRTPCGLAVVRLGRRGGPGTVHRKLGSRSRQDPDRTGTTHVIPIQ